MSALFWLIIVFILGEFALSKYLSKLNAGSWTPEVPEELRGLYDEEKYAKAQAYDKEKTKLGRISSYFSLALLLLMLFFKGFAWLNGWAAGITANPIGQALIFFGSIAIVRNILFTPFSIYAIFHIEDKYGFNKMTWKTYFTDTLKSLALSAIIGGGLISLIIWFYHSAGPQFWLYAWIAVTAISLFFAMFYTSLIVPMFNKLTPLDEGSLRSKIEEFANKVSFPLTNIFVIDGSKRTSKANAYFSGLGSKKSIVLYDTLMKDLTEEEIVAILAHEVGHYKRKHVQKGMVIQILNTGFMLWLIGLFVGSAPLSNALSVAEPNFHIGILVFSILYSPVSMVTGVLMNMFSRKNEYEADNYAKEHYDAAPLISSLKKLSVKHLSNLQPHPLFVFFNYSHPPLLERIRNLKE